MQVLDNLMQQRRCASDAGDVFHWRAVEIPDPDPHREFRRVAESPIVTEIGAGAGLASDGEVEAKRGLDAKG